MVRWEPDARGRLAQAALELYGEHGYEATTVAEIARRAGLTERTFFRYFADKREVLFAGGSELQELMVGAVAGAPAPDPALDAAAAGLQAAADLLQGRREFALERAGIIAANPELLERELAKMATLAAAIAEALRARGADELSADLTAQMAIMVFRLAFAQWIEGLCTRELPDLMAETLQALRSVAAVA